jgi:methylmalonyl-CoA/ethylmalonyl-CoA epimerase
MSNIHIDHISLLVKDLDTAVADWERILGALAPGHTLHVTRGEGADELDGIPMKWATFQNPDPRGVSIQLWAAAEPGTWVDKVLAKRGEYVHHIAFCSDDFDAMIGDVREAGVPLLLEQPSNPDSQPWLKWNFIPTETSHGPLIELATRYLAVGEAWLPHPGNAENGALATELTERFVK